MLARAFVHPDCRLQQGAGSLSFLGFVAAGVGNIYRAEILYKTGLHPEQPGHTVDRDTFEVGGAPCLAHFGSPCNHHTLGTVGCLKGLSCNLGLVLPLALLGLWLSCISIAASAVLHLQVCSK